MALRRERNSRPRAGPYSLPGLDLARSKSDISSSFDGLPPLPPALPFQRCRSEPQELPPLEEEPRGEARERPRASSHSIHLGLAQLGRDRMARKRGLIPRVIGSAK